MNQLAETIETSEDGLVISFKLKEGCQWHDGYGEVTTAGEIEVLVDTDTSKENVMRAAESQGCRVGGVSWVADRPPEGGDLTVKVRYLSRDVPVGLERGEGWMEKSAGEEGRSRGGGRARRRHRWLPPGPKPRPREGEHTAGQRHLP